MKLEDFLQEKDCSSEGKGSYEVYLEQADHDCHVIKTCGSCEYMELMTTDSMLEFMSCNNDNSEVEVVPKDFGCIHFEEKGKDGESDE